MRIKNVGGAAVMASLLAFLGPASARAEDGLTKYLPEGLKPLAKHASDLADAYTSITGKIELAQKVLNFVTGTHVKTEKELLAELEAQISLVAAETNWLVTSLDRQNRLADAEAALEQSQQELGWGQAVSSDVLLQSNSMTKESLKPIQFQRKYIDSVTGPVDGGSGNQGLDNWKYLADYTTGSHKPPTQRVTVGDQTFDAVYDWRLGVPQMMELIALRITVIAAADPSLRERRSVFQGELLNYKSEIESHVRTMADGVRCYSFNDRRTRDDLYVHAADIYSGAHVSLWFDLGPYRSAGVDVARVVKGQCDILRRQIMDSLPIADMQRMADTLGLLAYSDGDVPLVGDMDSDGKSDDLVIFRPSDGTWWAKRTDNSIIFGNLRWGTRGDIPLVGDFDGDGFNDDVGVWRPSTGTWWAMRTDGSVIFVVPWGVAGDVPLVGDFDSDGRVDDLGIFRPSNANWYALRSDGSFIFQRALGVPGDKPVVGDFDSDGLLNDLAVWNRATGMWTGMNANGWSLFSLIQWGLEGDVPMAGDLDGDGFRDDLVVWRPSEGTWWARHVDDSFILGSQWWGLLGDFPVLGDWDSDGRFGDPGVWRASNGRWYAAKPNFPIIFSDIEWGLPR